MLQDAKNPNVITKPSGGAKPRLLASASILAGDKNFTINQKPFEKYFIPVEFKNIIEAPLIKMNCADRFRVSVVVKGGGVVSQAEAIRHGITRALVLFNAEF